MIAPLNKKNKLNREEQTRFSDSNDIDRRIIDFIIVSIIIINGIIN